MKRILRIGIYFLLSCAAVVLGTLCYAFICQYPQNAYNNLSRKHPYDENCRAFAPNSNVEGIMQTLNKLPEPIEEREQGDQIIVRWTGGECRVDLDPITKRASKIQSQAFTGNQWNLEIH